MPVGNWWGSSAGPSVFDLDGATANPRLVLGAAAWPASIATTGTSAVSANLTYDHTGDRYLRQRHGSGLDSGSFHRNRGTSPRNMWV